MTRQAGSAVSADRAGAVRSANDIKSVAGRARSWWNGRTRLIVFVFGGLLVLQRSDTLDWPKLVYLVAAAGVVLSSVVTIWRTLNARDVAIIRPWLAVSAAFAVMVAVSLPIALAHEVGLVSWLRAAASYGLFAVAPLVAADARRAMSTKEAVGWMMLAGAIAAISFSIYWLQHRQIATLGIDPLGLPSAQLAYAGFAVAVACALASRSRAPAYLWAVAAGLILGALFITGTRTTFLLLAVPVILAVIVGRSRLRETASSIAVGAVTTALVFLLTIAALSGPTTPAAPAGSSGTPQATARPDLIGERLGSVGTILVAPAGGQSLTERLAQTRAAFATFAANPLLGSGPGRLYSWTNASGKVVYTRTLDTPLMIAAEFGLLGALVLIALVSAFVWFIRLMGRTLGRGPEYLSVIGLGSTFGLTSLLGPPMDDKGAAYALALVLTIALTAAAPGSNDVKG
jgi:hypothetical protein